MLLAEKVALITGASSGIGRASAQLLAREGARVVLADVNQEGGEEAVDQILQAGSKAAFVRTDVGKMSEVHAMVEFALKHYGRLDIIHSNAGVYGMKGSAVEITGEDWDRTLAVNLKAAWMIAHCAIPVMLDQGGGVMVITGSVHSVRGYAGYCAYQASKGGLLSLTRSLAADFAPSVRVNCILPGAVITGLRADVPEKVREQSGRFCALQRNAKLEEVAQAILFLASDMSSYMTGEQLVVDGGLTSIIRKYVQPSPDQKGDR